MLNDLNFAYGQPSSTGQIKSTPDDFCVEEELSFELSGEGEHLFLLIEKKLLNTDDMIKIIAKTLGLPFRAVAYAGLKDKYAKTTQWFSLHLPGKVDPNLDGLNQDNHRVLKAIRHNKKLKIGALRANRFTINVNNLVVNKDELHERIENVINHGVPNYFGPQRFGHHGNNLEHARDVLIDNKPIKNRHLRGLYYSAARAFLFNLIVSARIKAGTWNHAIPGDLMMLAGSHSIFPIDAVDEEIIKRVNTHDIFPTACLWGEGKELLTGDALDVQNDTLALWHQWCTGLEQHGLQKHYRAMVLIPEHLEFKDHHFTFTLPPGSYATAVLRELVITTNN